MSWTEVGPLVDIPKKGSRVLVTAEGDVAVFRTSGDQIFALFDQCPHKKGPLSQGIVYDNRVACPLPSAPYGHRQSNRLRTRQDLG